MAGNNKYGNDRVTCSRHYVQKESVTETSSLVQKIITYICCKSVKMSVLHDMQEYLFNMSKTKNDRD